MLAAGYEEGTAAVRGGRMKREYDFSKAERGKFYREDAELNLPRPTRQPRWAAGETEIVRFITETPGRDDDVGIQRHPFAAQDWRLGKSVGATQDVSAGVSAIRRSRPLSDP